MSQLCFVVSNNEDQGFVKAKCSVCCVIRQIIYKNIVVWF